LVLASILVCHWFGCMWWLISDVEIDITIERTNCTLEEAINEWHPPLMLKASIDLSLKYWCSFYWGAGIALSMVPHDVVPNTAVEAIATTVMMFVGLIIAAFVISSFTSAFASMDSKKQLAGKQLDLVRNYLLVKSVPTDLRSRILEYYQYIFTSSQSMEDLKVLQHMPLNLSTQLALSVNAKIIAKSPFFQDVSNASLAALVSTLAPLVFVPGQIMCTEGQPLRMIYFINRGQVQVVKRAGGGPTGGDVETVLRVLSETDNLGLDDFAHSAERRVRHTARSLTYCDVSTLTIEELSAALEHDAAERLKAEAARLKLEAEQKDGGASPSNERKHLTACLRKAGTIAKMSSAFRGGKSGAACAATEAVVEPVSDDKPQGSP